MELVDEPVPYPPYPDVLTGAEYVVAPTEDVATGAGEVLVTAAVCGGGF